MEEAQNRQNDIGEVYAEQKPKGKRLSAKSIVLIVLSVVFLAAAVLVPVLLLTSKNKIAYKEETVGDWVRQYNASTKTYDIVRYIGEPKTININGVTYENAVLIPLELEGISVGLIRAHAFDANENDTLLQVENIVFEKGTQISKIGDYAFDSCKNLKQIQIPASVKNVGSYAFNNCINLEKITIENAYGFTFSENALKGTDKLKTLEILSVTDNFDQSNTLGNIGSLNSNNNDLNLELGQGVNGIGSGFIASGVKELTVFNYKNLAIDSSTLYSVETLNIKYFGEGDETDTLTESFMGKFKSASNLKNINILDKEINKIGLYALTSFSGIEKLIVSSGTSFDINFTNTSDGTSHNANLAIYFKEDSDCSVTFYTTLLTNSTLGQNLINKFASDEKNKISTIIIEDSISQITCGINSEDGFKLVKNIKFDGNFSNVGNTFFSTQASNPFVVDNGIGLNIEGPESYNNAIFKNFNAPKGVFYKRASYNGKEEFGAVVINLVKVDKNGIRISNSTDRFIEVPVGVNIADYIIRTDADSVDNRYENPSIAIELIVNSELTFLPIDGVKFALATEEKISGTYDVDTKTMYVSNTFDVDGKVVEDNSTYQVYMVYEAQKTPVYFESYYNNIGSDGYGLYGESVSQPLATGETEKINIDKPGVVFDIETTKANNESIADLISYEDGKLVIIVDTSKIHNRDTIKLYYTRETYKVTISQNPDNDTVNEPSVPSVTEYEVTYGQNFTWLTEISVSRDGYTLVGWKYDDIVVNAGNYATVEYNTTAPTTVYAQWVAVNQNFTIKHWFENANNDSFTEDEDNRVTAQALAGTIVSDIAVDKLSVTGFAFSKIENTHDFIEGNGNTVINVYYVRNRLNITITPEAKGSSIIYYNGEVLYNGSIVTSKVLTLKFEQTIALEDLTREGYDFVGYLYNGNDFTLTEMPNNSIYLTDKWIPKTATITLDADGGTTAGNVTEITLTFDAKYPLLPTPTKKGYTFKDWYKVNGDNSTSDTKIEFNTSETVTNLENYTIRATWEAYTFTGEYYVDGTQVSTQTWTYDAETAVINADDVTKYGHTFDGWLLVGGSTYNKGDSVKALFTDAENGTPFTFNAVFTPYTLTVKYYVNSSLVEEKVWKFTDDAKVEIDNPTQKGYTFIGWNGEYTKGESINELFNGKENGDVINLSATFEKNSYFVEFNVNGGSFEGEDPSKEYEFDSTITLPNATKKGNTLKWSDGTTEYSAGAEYRLTEDQNVTFTAKWTPISSTVKFNSKGGSTVADIPVTYGQAYGQNIPEPTREGYDFDGWYANESYTGSKITFTSATTVELITDVTYYAKWNAKQYTITFNAGEGQVNPTQITVTYDKAYGQNIPEPTWAGYVFGGWFTDEEYTTGNEVSFSATDIVKITSNAVYYAQWALDSYTIIFDATDGSLESGVTAEGEYKFKSTITLPNATKKGYTLKWSDGTTEYSAGDEYEVRAEDVTFEAIWTAYTFTAEYYVDGTKTNTEKWYYDDIETAAITVNNASKDGHTFNNWALVGGGAYNKGDKVKTLIVDAENGTPFTFNAVFTPYTFTAEYYVDGASEATHTQTWTFGEQAVIGAANPTKTGHTFQYWTLRRVGGEYTQGKDVSALFTNADNGEVFEFDSYFKINSYTVTFDPNGGNLIGGNEVSIIFNNPVTLPDATNPGYTLKWKLEGAATADYIAGDEYIVKDHTKFIADWELNTYTVQFVPGNGQTIENKTINHGASVDLPTPTWAGHNFTGWEYNGQTYTGSYSPVVGDMTFTAKWTAINITITLDANGGTTAGNVTEITLTFDAKYPLLPTPTKKGYTFLGWFNIDESGNLVGEAVTFNTAEDVKILEGYTLKAKWEVNEYKVTYKVDGLLTGDTAYVDINGNEQKDDGEGVEVSVDVAYGTQIVFPAIIFDGHYDKVWKQNGVDVEDTIIMGTEALEFVATLTPKTATITFNTKNGTINVGGNGVGQTYTVSGAKYGDTITLPTASYTGHSYVWKLNGEDYTEATLKVEELTYTFTADWTPDPYTVTFTNASVGGDNSYVINHVYGSTFKLPNPDEEKGYEFQGWKNGETTYRVGTEFTQGLTVYTFEAVWEAVGSTITFDAKGGNVTPKELKVQYDSTYSISIPEPTWAGHSFDGWFTDKDCTAGNEVSFTAGAKVELIADVTYYAKWTINQYNVTFDPNGGEIDGTDPSGRLPYGTVIDIPNAEKTGYTFNGWKLNDATTAEYDAESTYELGAADVTFTADWTINQYKVTLVLNGGTLVDETIEGTYDYGTELTLPRAEKKGYTLKWNDGTTDRDAEYKFNLGDADVTFTAVWTPVKVIVKFDDDFGGTIADKEYTYDENYTGLPTPSEQPGYTFEGWYDESGNKIESNTQIKNDGTHTLKAKWSANVIAVTLNANGGNLSNTTIYVQFANKYGVYSDTAIESEDFESLTSKALPTPTRTGYTFKGWKLSGTVVTDTSEVTTATPHSLIADWDGNPFKVTYHSNVPGNDKTHDENYIYGTDAKLWTSDFTYVVDQKVWTLIGWTTNADGTGTYYSKDENVAFSVSDYDLYAKWSAEFIEFTLKITYDIIDNTGYGVETTTTTQTIIISQDGLEKDGDNFIVPSSAFTINSPYDFDAKYYTIYVDGIKVSELPDSYTLPQSGGEVNVTFERNMQTVTLLGPDGEDIGYSMELPYGANITKALESEDDDYEDFCYMFNAYMADDAVEGHYNNGFTVNEKELTSESIVDGPVTIQPIYVANSYTILFDKNDARAEQVTGKSTSTSFTYDADGTITLPVDLFTLYGKNLTAWKYTASDSNVISVDAEYKVNIKEFLENASTDDNNYLLGKVSGYTITIYANWEPKEVQVTLNPNGGTVTPTTITRTYGQAYGELPTPTWEEGREFDAWYDNNGNVITKDSIVNKENHTLTAEWIYKEITITLNANGGKVNGADSYTHKLTYGQKYVALPTESVVILEGHTFLGWYRNAEGTGDEVEFDTNATVNSTEEFTLYAKWEAITIDITLDANGGKVNGADSYTHKLTYGQKYVALPTESVVILEGHTFLGWYRNAEGTGDEVEFDTNATVDSTEEFTLYAKWQIKEFKVTFDPNGGTFDGPNTTEVNWGGTVTLPTKDTVTLEGHTLAGWQINGSGTIYTETYENVTSDMTFKAVWTTDRQRITFVYNNGDDDTTTEVNWGGTVTLPTPTWAGHNFTGWEYNGQTYTGSYSPVKGNMTFTAKWTAYTFTAEYYVDGIKTNTEEWSYDDIETAAITVNNASKDGHTFNNWALVGGGTYNKGDSVKALLTDAENGTTFKFNAVLTPYTFTAIYYVDNAEVARETWTYGEQAVIGAANPTEPGHDFNNWVERVSGKTYKKDASVFELIKDSANKTEFEFDAAFTPLTYTATFKSQYPGAEEVKIQVTYGKPYGTLPSLEYEGWTTDGWYVGETKITAETNVSTAGDHDVIGKVTINKYVVTFEGATFDGGKTTMTVDYLEKFQLPEPDELVGNNFLGWKNGETTYRVGIEFTQGLTEYVFSAEWQLKTYTITFDLNYDDAEDIIKTVSHGGTVTLDTPTRTGYTFQYWTLKGVSGEYKGTFANVTSDMTFEATWTAYTFTAEYYVDGELVRTDTWEYDEAATVLIEDPTKTGHTFVNWKESATSGTYVRGNAITGLFEGKADKHTFRFDAQWTINRHTVTLVLNGGTLVDETIEGTYDYGTELTLPRVEKTGCSLKWSDGTTEYSARDTFTLGDADVTFTAVWTAITYTATFKSQYPGAEEVKIQVTYGKPYGTLPPLEYEGYTTDGWYVGETKITAETNVSTAGDHDVIGKVTINQYNVTFDPNGGEIDGTDPSGRLPYGTVIDIPNATKKGNIFNGWKLNDATTAEYDAESTYELGAADVTFTADWTPITIDISLNPNGGTVTPTTITRTYGQAYGELPTPTCPGHKFNYWTLDGVAVNANTKVTSTGGHELKADWTPYTFTAEYYVDGELVRTDTWEYDEVATVSIEDPTKPGRTFANWRESATSGTYDRGDAITGLFEGKADKHTFRFDAAFTPNDYTITFNVNNSCGTCRAPAFVSPQSLTLTYNTKYGVDIPEAELEGHKFDGWYTNANFTGNTVTFAANDTFTLTSDVTYYAKFTPYTFHVEYYVDGTLERVDDWEYCEEAYVKMDDPTKTGYTFKGWNGMYYFGDNIHELFVGKGEPDKTTTITLTAVWEAINVIVTLDPNDGKVNGKDTDTIPLTYGQAYGELPEPTWAGHDFGGWKLNGERIDASDKVQIATPHTLVAVWTPAVYKVSLTIYRIYDNSLSKFVDGGNTTLDIYVRYGSTFGKYIIADSRPTYDVFENEASKELPAIDCDYRERIEGYYINELSLQSNTEVEITQDVSGFIQMNPKTFEVKFYTMLQPMGVDEITNPTQTYGLVNGFDKLLLTDNKDGSYSSHVIYEHTSGMLTFTAVDGYYIRGIYRDSEYSANAYEELWDIDNTNTTATKELIMHNGYSTEYYIVLEKASVLVTLTADAPIVNGFDNADGWTINDNVASKRFDALTYTEIVQGNLATPKVPGYKFDGWKKDGVTFTSYTVPRAARETLELSVTPGDGLIELLSAEIEFKALDGNSVRQDDFNNFDVASGYTFEITNVNGCTIDDTIVSGIALSRFTFTASLDGYEYIGLYIDGVRVDNNNSYVITENVILEARFVAKRIIVNIEKYVLQDGTYVFSELGGQVSVFDAMGGVISPINPANPTVFEVFHGETLTIEGSANAGFSVDAIYKDYIGNGATSVDGSKVIAGGVFTPEYNESAAVQDKSIKLSIVFETKLYTIKATGEESWEEDGVTFTPNYPTFLTNAVVGNSFTITNPTGINGSKKVFLGYEYGGHLYVSGDTFKLTSEIIEMNGDNAIIELRAVWSFASIMVTVEKSDGTTTVTNYANNSDLQTAINALVAVNNAGATITIDLFGEFVNSEFNNVYNLSDAIFGNNLTDGKLIIRSAGIASIVIKKGLGNMFTGSNYSIEIGEGIVLDGNASSGSLIAISATKSTSAKVEIYGMIQNAMTGAVKLTQYNADINGMFVNNQGTIFEFVHGETNNTNSTLSGWFANNNAGESALISGAGDFTNAFVALDSLMFANNIGKIATIGSLNKMQYYDIGEIAIENHTADSDDALFFVEYEESQSVNAVRFNGLNITVSNIGTLISASIVDFNEYIFISDSNTFTYSFDSDVTSNMLYVDASSIHFNVSDASYVSNLANKRLSNSDINGTQTDTNNPYFGKLYLIGDPTITNTGEYTFECNNLVVDTLIGPSEIREYGKEIYILGNGVVADNVYGQFRITGNAKVYNVYGEVTFDSLFNVNQSPYINIHSDKMNEVAFHYGNIDIANALMPKLTLISSDAEAFIANVRSHAWIAKGPFAVLSTKEQDTISGQAGYTWVNGKLTWILGYSEPVGTFFDLTGVDMSVSGWETAVGLPSGYNSTTIVITEDTNLDHSGISGLSVVAAGNNYAITLNGANHCRVGETGGKIIVESVNTDTNISVGLGYNAQIRSSLMGVGDSGFINYNGGSLYYGFDESTALKENPLFTLQNKMFVEDIDTYKDVFAAYGGIVNANTLTRFSHLSGNAIVTGNVNILIRIGGNATILGTLGVSGNNKVEIEGTYWYGSIGEIVYDGEYNEETIILSSNYLEQDNINAKVRVNGELVTLAKLAAPVDGYYGFIANDKNYAVQVGDQVFESINDEAIAAALASSDKTIHLIRDITASDITADINNINIIIDGHNSATIDMAGASQFEKATIKDVTITGVLDKTYVIEGEVNYTGNTAQITADITVNGTLNVFDNTFDGYIFAPSALAGDGTINIYQNNASGALISDGAVAKLNVYDNSGAGVMITGAVTELDNVMISKNGGDGLVIDALGATYIEITNITITGNNGHGVVVNNPANRTAHVSMSNYAITNNAGNGIEFTTDTRVSQQFVLADGMILSNGEYGINLYDGYELTIAGAIVYGSGSVGVNINSGVAILDMGTITGFETGVYIKSGARFDMNNGTIANCSEYGVYVEANANFNMTGGEIANISSSATTYSLTTPVAVKVLGNAIIDQGSISNSAIGIDLDAFGNLDLADGALINNCTTGLSVNSDFTFTGGTIYNCEMGIVSNNKVIIAGGAIAETGIAFCGQGALKVEGGYIYSCDVVADTTYGSGSGGAEYAFEMTGGEIDNCSTIMETATYAKVSGGRITNVHIAFTINSILIEGDAYISGTGEKDSTLGWSGTLTMNGGVVENFDIAVKDMSYDQGYVLVNTVTINDGVIRNCGIAAQGLNITMNGGRIENCGTGLEGWYINFGGDAVITHDLAENGSVVSGTYGIYTNILSAISDHTVTITGGVIENLAIAIDNDFNNSEVNFSNGLIQNCERAIVAGTGLMSGGKIYNCNDGVIFNNLTGRVTGGEIVNEIGGNTALNSYSDGTTSFEFSNVTISGYETAVSSTFVVMKSGTIENCNTALSGMDVTIEDGLINNCDTGVECSYTTMTGGTIKNASLAISTSTITLSGGTITNDLVNGKVKTGTIGVKPLTMGNAADASYVFITGGAISNCEVGIMSNVFMNNGDEITGVKISNCTYGISWNQSNPYKVNLGAGVEITDCGTGVFMNQVNIVGGVKIAGCDVGIHTNGYTMAGGEITNCTKGVYVGGDGTITAGTLTNCEIAIEGSVSFGGTATITNDLVNGKVKAGTTGIKAIANSNTVSMTGGEISNCEYGVDVAFSGLSMSNGEIKNCTYGAANSEDFTYGISISNLAKITNCGYGIKSFGIYEINNGEAPAEVTISGGTISGCSTAVFGDRVEIIGAAIITDGNIGIISQYELSMTAGTISGFDDKAIYCFGSAFITGGYISNCAYGIVKDAYGFGEGNIIIGAVQVSDCEVGACFVGMHGTNVNITGTFKNCNIGVIIEEVNSGTIQLTGAVIQDFDSCGISIISSTAEITMSSCIITTNIESTIAVGYTGSQESLTINSSVLTATTGISLDSGKITINDISIENCEKGIEATATGTIVAKGGEISGCDYGIYAPEGSVEDFAMTITTITDDGVVGVQAGTIVSTGGEISNMTTGIIVEGNSGSQIENTTITNCEVGIKADNSVTIINPYIEITDSSLKAEGTIGVDAVNPVINKGMICGYDIGVNISGTGSIDASIRENNIGVYVTSGQVGTEINISGNIGNNTTGIILDENFVGTVNFGSQSGAVDMIDANYDGGVKVYGGTFKLLSGDIVTNSLTGSEKFGAGIYVAGANANLEINGGSVSLQNQDSGKARFGGGVYFAGNTFTMNGGAIRDNAATEAGGGVYIAAGQMIINGGSIEANTVVNTDKDVYGAGIYVANYTLPTGVSSALNISGGSISGNSITSENGDEYGAGLYIDNVAVMSEGIVKDHNAVDGKAKYGGGAYITENGSLTMNGGAFLNNYATVDGGGIYDNGTFVMTGGTVSYNGKATNDTTIESKEYFTIVFDGAGADSGSIAAVMVVKVTGEITGTTKLPVNKFVKDGYTFGGWEYTDANGNTASIAPGSDLVYVETMASNGVITLTAIWNEITE